MEMIREVRKGDRTESDHVSLEVDLEIELEAPGRRQVKKSEIIQKERSVFARLRRT